MLGSRSPGKRQADRKGGVAKPTLVLVVSPVAVNCWVIGGEFLSVQHHVVLVWSKHWLSPPAQEQALHGFPERCSVQVERVVDDARPKKPAVTIHVQFFVSVVSLRHAYELRRKQFLPHKDRVVRPQWLEHHIARPAFLSPPHLTNPQPAELCQDSTCWMVGRDGWRYRNTPARMPTGCEECAADAGRQLDHWSTVTA